MIFKTKLMGILVIFIVSTIFACGANTYINQQTKDISELLKIYTLSDDKEKEVQIKKIDDLSKNNPNDVNVVRIYASILSSRGEYEKAIPILNKFNKINKNAELSLQECMLKDRIGDYDKLCYRKALSLIENKTNTNMDVLMILYLTHDDEFNKEKELYINKTHDSQSVEIFNIDKSTFLERLYPN